MKQNETDKLSKSDVISFVALLLLGVAVFFGMNYSTVGDIVLSAIVGVLTVIFLTGFVMFASYAKAQTGDFSLWRKVEIGLVVLYVVALIPCYAYVAKFVEIQSSRSEIRSELGGEMASVQKMFNHYEGEVESRYDSYRTNLEAMWKSPEGRMKLKQLFHQEEELTRDEIKQFADNFQAGLTGKEYTDIKNEMNVYTNEFRNYFQNWNMIQVPRYVRLLNEKKHDYARRLSALYSASDKKAETEVERPVFDATSYVTSSGMSGRFSARAGFTGMGIVVIIILGLTGLSKYFFTERTALLPPAFREDTIEEDGGYTFN